MRILITLLLLSPLLSFGQPGNTLPGLNQVKKDSSCIAAHLPVLPRSDFSRVYELESYTSNVYVISQDSIYYKIFSRYPKDSLPVFDFKKQELRAKSFCTYCIGLGTLNGQPKHRNACSYRFSWLLCNKKSEQ